MSLNCVSSTMSIQDALASTSRVKSNQEDHEQRSFSAPKTVLCCLGSLQRTNPQLFFHSPNTKHPHPLKSGKQTKLIKMTYNSTLGRIGNSLVDYLLKFNCHYHTHKNKWMNAIYYNIKSNLQFSLYWILVYIVSLELHSKTLFQHKQKYFYFMFVMKMSIVIG